MSEIDQQFIEYVVKSLVGKPEAVSIERRIDEKGVLLELTVDPEDLGRVIGKRGATAQSLRTLLRALGTKNEARYNLKIIDNGDPEHKRPPRDEADHEHKSDHNDSHNEESPREDTPQESADSPKEDVPEAPAAEEAKPEEVTEASEEDQTSDRLRQARAELDDLDDLDI